MLPRLSKTARVLLVLCSYEVEITSNPRMCLGASECVVIV